MSIGKLTVLLISASVFTTALLTGPPSFDSTDGAEFAVAGSRLEIAHAPGYPLFLMFIRVASMVLSPLYGHLRIINCIAGALVFAISFKAFRKLGTDLSSSICASVLFISAAPVMAQVNSLEVYPLAMLLTFSAILLRETRLMAYATGMAVFAGHPVSILCAPLMTPSSFRLKPLLYTGLIPASLLLYVPIRALSSTVAHYGHPFSSARLADYFTMYSNRLAVPSMERLVEALSSMGIITGAVILLFSVAGGKLRFRQDIPAFLALLFLASYEMPDPAGQLWVLLLPVAFRCARGIERLTSNSGVNHLIILIPVLLSAVSGTVISNRSNDDIALMWTMDVMRQIPHGDVYRPVAHDAFYAAYAVHSLGIRSDIILSDPMGNYFELPVPAPVPPVIGDRLVHISRAWDRTDAFELKGLIFHPRGLPGFEPDWESMDIFNFNGTSPDPMAMDIVAEAWARRMVQETDPELRDSFYTRAIEFAATELTGRRIESLRNHN